MRSLTPNKQEHATLEQRLDELETRITFQEQALIELSNALTQSRLEYARTHEVLSRALDDLRQVRGLIAVLDPASELPPHY